MSKQLSEKDRGNLMAIIDAATKIQRFTKEFKNADSFNQDEKNHLPKLIQDIKGIL